MRERVRYVWLCQTLPRTCAGGELIYVSAATINTFYPCEENHGGKLYKQIKKKVDRFHTFQPKMHSNLPMKSIFIGQHNFKLMTILYVGL